MKTSERSERQLSLPSISSAEASPARTSAPLARELALTVLVAASGLSSVESFRSFCRGGWWLRTSPAERIAGLTRSARDWQSSGTRAYRSRLRQLMSAHRTSAAGCSLLRPTLTETGNLLSPSMQKWPAHRRLLPTLTKSQATRDSMRGANAQGGPHLLEVVRTMLPTLVARDAKGPGPTHSKSGVDLPQVIGGHLSPTWCEWFMGFPESWTEPVRALQRSATRSSRSARKSSAG